MSIAKDLIETLDEARACYHCGKQIKGEYKTRKLPGYDKGSFHAAYHPDCYDKSEKEAEKELHKNEGLKAGLMDSEENKKLLRSNMSNYSDTHMGHKIEMVSPNHYRCPSLKLFGYSSVRQLKNAIAKKVAK
jgi:hypothetical protein